MASKDYLDRVGLMIGVPLSGNLLVPQWAFAFQNQTPPMNYNLRYGYVTHTPVDQARNTLLQLAIKDNCEFMYFIDEDVTPPPHALKQLLFDMVHYPNVAVVGGIYCHKDPPAAPMVFRGNGHGPYWDWKLGELFEVTGIGMGCTLIRTEALKDIDAPWFCTVEDSHKYLDGVNSAAHWTEDLYFCRKIVDTGKWDIMADGGIICEHWDTRPCKLGKPAIPVVMPPNAKIYGKAGVKKGDKKIVDLGAGEDPLKTDEGQVLTVDIREEVNPDYRNDLRHLPFANEEMDVVYSSHTLEHFTRKEIPHLLDEWIRILKPTGELRLHLPNIQWACEKIMGGVLPDPTAAPWSEAWNVLNVIYGLQDYPQNHHKMCFTPESIAAMLNDRGFKRIDVNLSGYNIIIRGWRVEPDDKDVPKLVTKDKALEKAANRDAKGEAPVVPECYKCMGTGVVKSTGYWCDCEAGTKRKEFIAKPEEGVFLTDEQMAKAILPGERVMTEEDLAAVDVPLDMEQLAVVVPKEGDTFTEVLPTEEQAEAAALGTDPVADIDCDVCADMGVVIVEIGRGPSVVYCFCEAGKYRLLKDGGKGRLCVVPITDLEKDAMLRHPLGEFNQKAKEYGEKVVLKPQEDCATCRDKGIVLVAHGEKAAVVEHIMYCPCFAGRQMIRKNRATNRYYDGIVGGIVDPITLNRITLVKYYDLYKGGVNVSSRNLNTSAI